MTSHEPLVWVVKGDPAVEELAVLTVVLIALQQARSATSVPSSRPTVRWQRPEHSSPRVSPVGWQAR